MPEEKKKLMDGQQLQSLSARVDKIKIDLSEKEMLCQQLKAQNAILTKEMNQEKNLFQNEIVVLKDQVSSLKEQLEITQNNLKKSQQSSLLQLVKPDDDKIQEKSMTEEILVLKEALVKAEQDANNWRL